MTLDERHQEALREALRDEADSVEPGDDGWEHIQAWAATAERRARVRRRGLIGLAAVAAIAIIAGAVALANDQGQDVRTQPPAGSTGTTPQTSTPTTPTVPPTGGGTTVPPPTTPAVDPSQALWPPPGSQGIDDPVGAATTFMTKFVGMSSPIVGDFQQGDGQSGEVEVRSNANAPALTTTVLLRRLDTVHWWVIGSVSHNVRLDSPSAQDAIASPLTVRGAASAFEGNVRVEVRQDGQLHDQNLGEAPVTGSGGPELGPFEGNIEFRAPSEPFGALVLTTNSARDGSVEQATVVRIRFGAIPANESCTPAMPTGPTVKVYLLCEEQSLVEVRRAIADRPDVLRAALEALLAGPTTEEEDTGLFSVFSQQTAGALNDVTISDGTAIVDLSARLLDVIPRAPVALQRQLDHTVFQFPTVDRAEYRIDGSCERWAQWIGTQGCTAVPPTD